MTDAYLGNPNLKKVNTPVEFTKENIIEFKKCEEECRRQSVCDKSSMSKVETKKVPKFVQKEARLIFPYKLS